MTNLEKAKARIETCRKENSCFLSLANLALTTNEFKELIPEINSIRSLKKLDMSNNDIDEVPNDIKNVNFLEELNFSRNRIDKLSKRIENFSNLRVLNLAHNRLKKLPKQFHRIAKFINSECILERLDLSNNNLRSIPYLLGNLEQHTQLILDNNSVRLPINRGLFSLGTSLNSNSNSIKIGSIISAGIPINSDPLKHNINRLKTHVKGGVRAIEIEDAISSVQNNTLDLSGTDLSNEELTKLLSRIAKKHPNLEVLKLANNNLTELPDSIGSFPLLKKIDVSNNDLKTLPDTIGQLSLLKELDASYNDIQNLPESMEHLSRLKEINLKCNFDETLTECLNRHDALSPVHGDGIYPLSRLLPKMREKGILANKDSIGLPKKEDGIPNDLEPFTSPLLSEEKRKKSTSKRFRFRKKDSKPTFNTSHKSKIV